MDFTQFVNAGNATMNASLNTGHRYQALFACAGFSAILEVEHPVNGVEKFTPEYNALQAAEKSGRLADASTIIGARQRSALADADPDSATTDGLPLDLPVFLFAEVQFRDEPGDRYNVGTSMASFDQDIKDGKGFAQAFEKLIGEACRKSPHAGTPADLALEVESGVKGLDALVMSSVPGAKA